MKCLSPSQSQVRVQQLEEGSMGGRGKTFSLRGLP